MSGIIGPITAGRIAFALGTVGVGALVGGAVADHNDGDVAKGALIGGASALAGLAVLYGGAAAWKHFTAGRAGAATGVSTLGTSLSHTIRPPVAPTLSTVATTVSPTATAATSTVASGWRTWVSSLFQEASAVTTLRPVSTTIPTIAATPLLPVATASSGSTFLNTMSRFLPG